jgi:hypothetical protein
LQLAEIFGSFQEPSPSSTSSLEIPEESSCGGTSSCDTEQTTYYSPADPTPMVERVAPANGDAHEMRVQTELAPLNEEIQRLKNLVTLQERILDMKESEIQDLRSQRDWLRTRVEKLEEKGDRDQVLLLSETQAIRQLIGLQQKRPSAIRSLLEWLGLGNSDSVPALPSNHDIASAGNSQGTIVVNKAANG